MIISVRNEEKRFYLARVRIDNPVDAASAALSKAVNKKEAREL